MRGFLRCGCVEPIERGVEAPTQLVLIADALLELFAESSNFFPQPELSRLDLLTMFGEVLLLVESPGLQPRQCRFEMGTLRVGIADGLPERGMLQFQAFELLQPLHKPILAFNPPMDCILERSKARFKVRWSSFGIDAARQLGIFPSKLSDLVPQLIETLSGEVM